MKTNRTIIMHLLETGLLNQYRIMTITRNGWPGNQGSISAKSWDFSLFHTVGATQPSSLSTLELISTEVNWPRRETDHSSPHLRICIYGMVLVCCCLLVSFLFGETSICWSPFCRPSKFSYSHGATRLCLHGTAYSNGPFAICRKGDE